MNWTDAYTALENGEGIKLPEWAGYWKREAGTNKIFIHKANGGIVNILDTEDAFYTLGFIRRDDWEIATVKNSNVMFKERAKRDLNNFGHAVFLLKQSKKVTCDFFPDNVYLEFGSVIAGGSTSIEILICRDGSPNQIWMPSQEAILNTTWKEYTE